MSVDRDRDMVEWADLVSDVSVVQADGQQLPLRSELFDVVLFNVSLESMQAAEALREAFRVLRPDGRLIAMVGHQVASPEFRDIVEQAIHAGFVTVQYTGLRLSWLGQEILDVGTANLRDAVIYVQARKPAAKARWPRWVPAQTLWLTRLQQWLVGALGRWWMVLGFGLVVGLTGDVLSLADRFEPVIATFAALGHESHMVIAPAMLLATSPSTPNRQREQTSLRQERKMTRRQLMSRGLPALVGFVVFLVQRPFLLAAEALQTLSTWIVYWRRRR